MLSSNYYELRTPIELHQDLSGSCSDSETACDSVKYVPRLDAFRVVYDPRPVGAARISHDEAVIATNRLERQRSVLVADYVERQLEVALVRIASCYETALGAKPLA